MIRLENVAKIYDINVENKKALDNVNLEIGKGEFVAITGPSGSGKSTLLNIIGCMDTVTEGRYYLDGCNVVGLRRTQIEKVRKEKIGFIFQHYALMDYYTAYENIELPLIVKNINASVRKKSIMETMKAMNIVDIKNKIPSKMSGGQRQRVAIARAVVSGCSVILADEPTGALDQATGKEVLKILRDIHKKGTTVIVVTHDKNVAAGTDRIIQLCDGRIVEDKKQR